MKEFADKIKNLPVGKGQIGVIFMGQAGFIFKDEAGHLIAYDIYLSDCCEREFGFKRMLAKLLEPDDITFDAIICSHGHYDHFDKDAIPALISDNKTLLYTTQDGVEELVSLNIPKERANLIKRGDRISLFGNIDAEFVYCDHGELAPYAVGTVLTVAGKKLYFAGDTAYRPEQLVNESTKDCDLAVLPINGAFGNLNETEAVSVAEKLGAKLTVPCHFWNFPEHGGDPALFISKAKEKGINYKLMAQGDTAVF